MSKLSRNFFIFAALLFLGAIFRFAVVSTFYAPAGDGHQYYALSQELLREGNFSYGPTSALTYSRLPGYPLFLAYVAVRKNLPLVPHLIRATQANVFLDLGTALLIFLMLRSLRGVSRLGLAPILGLVFVVLSPILLRLSCYGLTESLAAFLSTLALYLALRAGQAETQRFRIIFAIFLGVIMGLGQLVRADALALWPALLVLLLGICAQKRQAILVLLVAGFAALVVFAPWPLRNQKAFGHPYPFSWQWRTFDGQPLPTGPLNWARTWTRGEFGESYVDLLFAISRPLEPLYLGALLPHMFDSDEEKAKTTAVFTHYNRERLSPAVNAEFEALAASRRAAHPLRHYLGLPLVRMKTLWRPVVEGELPLRVRWLGLPRLRPVLHVWECTLYGLAALGAVALFLNRQSRPLLGGLLVYVAARSFLLAYTVPLALTQRLLGPVMPAVVALSACGAAFLFSSIYARLKAHADAHS